MEGKESSDRRKEVVETHVYYSSGVEKKELNTLSKVQPGGRKKIRGEVGFRSVSLDRSMVDWFLRGILGSHRCPITDSKSSYFLFEKYRSRQTRGVSHNIRHFDSINIKYGRIRKSEEA